MSIRTGAKKPMKFLRSTFVAAILILSSTVISAQAPAPSAAPGSNVERKMGESTPVFFWNRQITTFRSYYDQLSPAERAARAAARIASLPEEGERDIVARETTSEQHSGTIITVNGQFILVILSEDLDRESSETLKGAADQATSQLRIALDARARQRRWPVLLKAVGSVIAATLIALFGLWLLMRGGTRLHALMARRASAHSQRIKLGGIDPEPVLRSLAQGI